MPPRTRRQVATAKALAKVTNAPVEETIKEDEDEEDIGKTLHAKDGKLGYVTSKGFVSVTNFLVDIHARLFSQKYLIKGIPMLILEIK